MSDRSRYRRGDFEARQRQLPADRHARQAKMSAMAKARTDQENTPLGSPPKPVDVRSVYDTRPINAFDFNISASASVNSVSPSATLFFSVPQGFICVLRNFDIWFEPNPVASDRSAFQWSLQLNGGDFPYNLNVPFGIAVDRETCFMIANEFNTVGLRITLGTAAEFADGTIFGRFYGNFLLKSGLPSALEIGNLVPTAAQPPPKMPRPPPTAPPPAPAPTPASQLRFDRSQMYQPPPLKGMTKSPKR
jgi:hypothetical protein